MTTLKARPASSAAQSENDQENRLGSECQHIANGRLRSAACILIFTGLLTGCQQPGIATRHRMMCEQKSRLIIIDQAAWPKFVQSLARSKPHNKSWFGRSNSEYLIVHEKKEAILGRLGIVRDDFIVSSGFGQPPIAKILNFSFIQNTFDTRYIMTCADWPASRYVKEFEHVR